MQRRWITRWFGEFTVIVFGVLVALGVDDWQQDRADRELEAHLMERLADDLRADAADLSLASIGGLRRGWVLEAILTDLSDGVANGSPRLPPPDSLVEAHETRALMVEAGRTGGALFQSWTPLETPLQTFYLYPEFDLSDDSFQEMLAAGAIRTLQDRSLRSAVLAYYRVAADMGENERREAAYQPRLEQALSQVGVTLSDELSLAQLAAEVVGSPQILVEIRRALRGIDRQQLFLGYIEDARSRLEMALAESGDPSGV